jgi:hypothetical protein
VPNRRAGSSQWFTDYFRKTFDLSSCAPFRGGWRAKGCAIVNNVSASTG